MTLSGSSLVLATGHAGFAAAVRAEEPGSGRLGQDAPVEPAGAPTALLHAWLAGDPATLARPARPKRRAFAPIRPAARLPRGATLMVDGLSMWSKDLSSAIENRPDVTVVALLDGVEVATGWPEYAAAGDRDRIAALIRRAALTVTPDPAGAAAVRTIDARAVVQVEPKPSGLADGDAEQPPPGPPYCLACGPLDERANTVLLLQIWRAALASGDPLPRLVLAGSRGRQTEEIAPLLDWNETLRAHVAEVGHPAPGAFRSLVAGAAALLAPDFAGPETALLRDAATLGVRVLAAETPQARTLGLQPLLSPIDGPGWIAAIRAAAAEAPRSRRAGPLLLGWNRYAARLCAAVRALSRTAP